MIRHAEPLDAPQILGLFERLIGELKTFGGYMMWTEKTRSWIALCIDLALAEKGACFVVEDGDALVAVSLAFEMEMPYDSRMGRAAYGLGTYVKPEHRKRGLAEALYETVAQTLRERGYETYVGGVLIENEPAARVVSRNGFYPFEIGVARPLERPGDIT